MRRRPLSVCRPRGGRYLISLTVRARVWADVEHSYSMCCCHAEIYIYVHFVYVAILRIFMCFSCISVFVTWFVVMMLLTKHCIMWKDWWSSLGLFTEGWQDVTEDGMWLMRLRIPRDHRRRSRSLIQTWTGSHLTVVTIFGHISIFLIASTFSFLASHLSHQGCMERCQKNHLRTEEMRRSVFREMRSPFFWSLT